MAGLFSSPKMSSPTPVSTPPPALPPQPAPPQYEGLEVQAARDKQRKQAALAAGRASTMATGPLGLTGPAPVLRQTLGGQ